MTMKRQWLRSVLSTAVFFGAMGFGIVQAYATGTDTPGREMRGFCDDVAACMATCGMAGGIYYGTMPNGQPLCDCCAPD